MSKKDIYLDNAATTACLPKAADLMRDILVNNYGNPSSIHLKGVKAEEELDKARQTISGILKCKEKEIIFTSGGTEANNTAILGSVAANKRLGKHIITTAVEHSSVYKTMAMFEKAGYEITHIPVDEKGKLRIDMFAKAISTDTILVSVMHVNNETGVVMPIEEIGHLIQQKSSRCIFHVDAVQSVGKIPLNLSKSHVDLLSASAHKFHGPKGVGFLYKKENININPYLIGGGQERGFRSGTENVAGIAAMALALDSIYSKNAELDKQLWELKDYFVEAISKLENCFVNGTTEKTFCAANIVNATFRGVRSEVLIHALEEEGIYASSGSACSSHSKAKSRSLLAMGMSDDDMDSSLRFSFSKDTTIEELEYTIKTIEKLLPKLRKFTRK